MRRAKAALPPKNASAPQSHHAHRSQQGASGYAGPGSMRPVGRSLAAARSRPSVEGREGRLRLAVTIPRANSIQSDPRTFEIELQASLTIRQVLPADRSLPDSPRRRWSPKQIRRLDAKAARQPVKDVDAGSINAALNRAHIGAIDPCMIGELFL